MHTSPAIHLALGSSRPMISHSMPLVMLLIVAGGCFFFGTMYRPEFRVGVTGLHVSDTARPVQGDSFEDDQLAVAWEFPRRKLKVTIVNKSSTALTIDWPRAKFTDFRGIVQGLRDISRKGNPPKLETLIQPGDSAVEWIYPAGFVDQSGRHVRLQPSMGGAASEDLDRVERFGQQNLGKHALIELPIRLGDGTTRTYAFRLTTLEFFVDKFVGT